MYVSSREACTVLGVHPNTLRSWADTGKIPCIRTQGGQRRYDVEGYLLPDREEDYTIAYCRVSSGKQKDDLLRQEGYLRALYPEAEIIKDIGSGINYNRKGVKTILERLLRGDKFKLVVAHKDRLARFGTEIFEFLLRSNGGELLVLDNTTKSTEEQLTEDLLTILHVFSCRMHGSRKYKKAKDKTK